jgi:hypothetical protein
VAVGSRGSPVVVSILKYSPKVDGQMAELVKHVEHLLLALEVTSSTSAGDIF